GGSVRRQGTHESTRGVLRVSDLTHADFLRQRHVLEPVEQRSAQRTDDPELRKVHVRVDEPWHEKAAAPISDWRPRGLRMRGADALEISARRHAAIANQQPAVPVAGKFAAGRMENGGAKELHQGSGVMAQGARFAWCEVRW